MPSPYPQESVASTLQPTAETVGRPWLSEDWLAVCIAYATIGVVLAGWLMGPPCVKYASLSEFQTNILAPVNCHKALGVACVVGLGAVVAIASLGGSLLRFALGFPVVYVLALAAQLMAGHAATTGLGLEYVIFALGLGLLVGNLFGTPAWLQEAVRTEFYIKTGLVLLGSSMLFRDILQGGALGLAQAFGVVIPVWFFCFWLARKLRVDDEFAVMLSSAVSICGVSAAIAACGAVQGDQKKLSYVSSLVLLVAVPMMVLMPWIVRTAGIPDVMGGAWLGGTLDTSGSVVAAGALISQPAMKAGVVVKFAQNVLIGLAAFVLSIWWAMRRSAGPSQRPTARVIWDRFPKFVLGFVVASLVFSFVLAAEQTKGAKPMLEGLRNAWFALAFTCVGLETRLGDLLKMGGGRPALAFVGAQAFNTLWTLLLAYLLFGGALLPIPTFQ